MENQGGSRRLGDKKSYFCHFEVTAAIFAKTLVSQNERSSRRVLKNLIPQPKTTSALR
jgi:hypothetical protein